MLSAAVVIGTLRVKVQLNISIFCGQLILQKTRLKESQPLTLHLEIWIFFLPFLQRETISLDEADLPKWILPL